MKEQPFHFENNQYLGSPRYFCTCQQYFSRWGENPKIWNFSIFLEFHKIDEIWKRSKMVKNQYCDLQFGTIVHFHKYFEIFWQTLKKSHFLTLRGIMKIWPFLTTVAEGAFFSEKTVERKKFFWITSKGIKNA